MLNIVSDDETLNVVKLCVKAYCNSDRPTFVMLAKSIQLNNINNCTIQKNIDCHSERI